MCVCVRERVCVCEFLSMKMATDKYVFNISFPVFNISVPVNSLYENRKRNMSIFFKNGLLKRLHKYEMIIDMTFYFFILKYILRIE